MSHILPIGFVDTSQMTATLVNKHIKHMDSDTLALRRAGDNLPILKEWNSARALIAKIRNASAAFCRGKPAIVTDAAIDLLRPGAWTDWAQDESLDGEERLRLRVCLIPSPAAWSYCGGEAMVLLVGQVTYTNTRAPWCETNFGPVNRLHLVLDIEKPLEE